MHQKNEIINKKPLKIHGNKFQPSSMPAKTSNLTLEVKSQGISWRMNSGTLVQGISNRRNSKFIF